MIRNGHNVDMVLLRGSEDLPDIRRMGRQVLQHCIIPLRDSHDVDKHGDLILSVDAGVEPADDAFGFELINALLCRNPRHTDGIPEFLITHSGISLQQIQYLLICPVQNLSP